jgi:histidyl-tRNA synthetase
MQKGPTTPKGFRDIDPLLAKKRRGVINVIADVLEQFEFVPLETPIIEFAETLTGKYGEEEKLIYKFTDRGGRELALRYDLTVPLARYVANNLNVIVKEPFRRYQIGEVFRGENTQKGRWREFTQFDFDTVGSNDPAEDAKVIATAINASRKIGLDKAQMALNDRRSFENMPVEVIRSWDKLYKIGMDEVKKQVGDYIEQLNKLEPSKELLEIIKILEDEYRLNDGVDFFFDKTLARGLDYYTGVVMELKPTGKPEEQSIGGGGRYDNLIGMFAGKSIPAVGFSFGLDRLLELL